ncbi:signalosome complex subunit 5 [Seminavis robusta]|uniref:COP9 signalosome complex subunit 5 n=1 Tax=Seminavis robusta TaxID=568900 RepID=A0A9N8HMI6_9STRA|nr:signalosome complex subunit 5 [Seminavis robusta]|eukprot:Sro1003_g230030.1 signalosome complex subunit 5 (392) ;mRNA; r:18909-20303
MSAAAAGQPKDDGGSATAKNSMNLADARYTFQPEELQKLRTEAPWMKDAKYFQKVAISPSAIMKMMMHCHSGVEKGISKGGNPIEVMGMLLGRPDPDTPHTLVVSDAFPLPIEGFETRVIADDENVVNHMIALGESLERTRKEKFMGWYHSHPFDLADHGHCFLSQTDLSTELQWQRAEDPHGNPFVAIVVDPLRSFHLQKPEIKAFRAYPPEYNSPVANECPDGSIQPVEQLRLEQWGSCWNRYYELEVEYYMSSTSRSILEQLTQDYLWMRTLCSQKAQEGETAQKQTTQRLKSIHKSFQAAATKAANASGGAGPPGGSRAFGRAPLGGPGGAVATAGSAGGKAGDGGGGNSGKPSELSKAVQQLVDLAAEEYRESALQDTKKFVFGSE